MTQVETLLDSARRFHVWSYQVGQPELLLRSGFPHDDVVELLFEEVKSIQLNRLQLPDLEVRRAEDVLFDDGNGGRRFLKIELRTTGHVGYVVCGRLTFITGTLAAGKRQWSIRPRGPAIHLTGSYWQGRTG
jgi:hypothetical protein